MQLLQVDDMGQDFPTGDAQDSAEAHALEPFDVQDVSICSTTTTHTEVTMSTCQIFNTC